MILPCVIYGFYVSEDEIISNDILSMFSVNKFTSHIDKNNIGNIYYGIQTNYYTNGKTANDYISKTKILSLYSYLDKDIYSEPEYYNVLYVKNIDSYLQNRPIKQINIEPKKYIKKITMTGTVNIDENVNRVSNKIKFKFFQQKYIINYMIFDNDSDPYTHYFELSINIYDSNFFYFWNDLIENIHKHIQTNTALDALKIDIVDI